MVSTTVKTLPFISLKIKRAKKAALDANPGAEIIDMGVGEPDEMAFPEVVNSMRLKNRKTAATPTTAAKP